METLEEMDEPPTLPRNSRGSIIYASGTVSNTADAPIDQVSRKHLLKTPKIRLARLVFASSSSSCIPLPSEIPRPHAMCNC